MTMEHEYKQRTSIDFEIVPEARRIARIFNRVSFPVIGSKNLSLIRDFVCANFHKDWILLGRSAVAISREKEVVLTKEEEESLKEHQISSIEEYLSSEIEALSESQEKGRQNEVTKQTVSNSFKVDIPDEESSKLLPISVFTSNFKREPIYGKAILKFCDACFEKAKEFHVDKNVTNYPEYVEDRLSYSNTSLIEFLLFRRLFSLLNIHSLLVIGEEPLFKIEAARHVGVEIRVSMCTSRNSEHYMRKIVNEKVDHLQLSSESFESSFDFTIIDAGCLVVDEVDFVEKAMISVRPGGVLLIYNYKEDSACQSLNATQRKTLETNFINISTNGWYDIKFHTFRLFMKHGYSPR